MPESNIKNVGTAVNIIFHIMTLLYWHFTEEMKYYYWLWSSPAILHEENIN